MLTFKHIFEAYASLFPSQQYQLHYRLCRLSMYRTSAFDFSPFCRLYAAYRRRQIRISTS